MAKVRSQEEKSAIVAASGMMAEVWLKLREAVRDRKGVDADLYVLNTPEGRPIIVKLAEMIVAKAAAPLLQVAYALVLPWIIAACRFSLVDQNITAEHFPLMPNDLKIKEVKVVKSGRGMSTPDALKWLDEQGRRPATLLELLFWWLTTPDAQKDCLVVALGQTWSGVVVCVYGYGGPRNLGLVRVADVWNEHYSFAAVEKKPKEVAEAA